MFDHVRTHQPPAGCHLDVKEVERTGKNEEMAKKVAFFQKPQGFFSKPVPECTHRAGPFGVSKPIRTNVPTLTVIMPHDPP